jgi:hypothetical protein
MADLEERVANLEASLKEFDEVVLASIGQVLAAIGPEGELTKRIRNVEQKVESLETAMKDALGQAGDTRLLEAIEVSAREIKRGLNIK